VQVLAVYSGLMFHFLSMKGHSLIFFYLQKRRTEVECKVILERVKNFTLGEFHLIGHQPLCRFKFSHRTKPWTGIVNGEGMETLWYKMRSLPGPTRRMRPAHREDEISAFLGALVNETNDTLGEVLLCGALLWVFIDAFILFLLAHCS
jgi:hypothetical protein